jgi:hypothetical protein
VSGPGGDQMTSRPEHVQRRADPSGATLISVEVDPHCTPQWTESGRGLQRSPFTWMGSEAVTSPQTAITGQRCQTVMWQVRATVGAVEEGATSLNTFRFTM